MHSNLEEDPAPSERTGIIRQVRVANPTGLHLRLAADIVKAVRCLNAEILLEHQGARANAGSVLSIISLGAGYGATVSIHAVGADAPRALDRLLPLFAHHPEHGGQVTAPLEYPPTSNPRLYPPAESIQ